MCSIMSLFLLSACVLFTASSAQRSCRGRCGEAYFRGNVCQCDSECLSHNECCKNYRVVCTSGDSCKGRCGERFQRGQACHCDIECVQFNQCCVDYETQCNTEDSSEEEYREMTIGSPLTEVPMSNSPGIFGSNQPVNEVPDMTSSMNHEVFTLNSPEHEVLAEGINDSPVPAKDPENIQDKPEPVQFPLNRSAPHFLPDSTGLALIPQPSEQFPTTTSSRETTPASQHTDVNTEPTTPISTEPRVSVSSGNPETQLSHNASVPTSPSKMGSSSTSISDQHASTNSQSNSETKPTPRTTTQSNNWNLNTSKSVQEEVQLEPSENTTSGSQKIQKVVSTDKPTTAKITEGQNETCFTEGPLSTKDSPKYLTIRVGTTASTIDRSSTKPKDAVAPPQDLDDYQADANSDPNLCSGRPVNGLTMLRNGTIVVFRGHYFWMLDSRRHAGPPQLITDFWGIPSPIDTVFTRCNCQGKTYIFRGNKYWKFENSIMDAGFPRLISEGFGLGGHIVAALSTPQYRSRKEAVLFFKTGGVAQRYTYLNTPECGSKSATLTVKKRFRKEAAPTLGQQVIISKTWVGFPQSVTSAVSVRDAGGDGYKYYAFSPTKYYSLKMEGDTPVILTPRAGQEKQKSAKSWFRCPEKSEA